MHSWAYSLEMRHPNAEKKAQDKNCHPKSHSLVEDKRISIKEILGKLLEVDRGTGEHWRADSIVWGLVPGFVTYWLYGSDTMGNFWKLLASNYMSEKGRQHRPFHIDYSSTKSDGYAILALCKTRDRYPIPSLECPGVMKKRPSHAKGANLVRYYAVG